MKRRPTLTFLVAALIATPTLARTITLPLRGTDGWQFELPVKPGTRVSLLVPGGIRAVRQDHPNPDYTTSVNGRTLFIRLDARAALPGAQRAQGSTVCLTISTLVKTRYVICPTAEARGVGESFRLKP